MGFSNEFDGGSESSREDSGEYSCEGSGTDDEGGQGSHPKASFLSMMAQMASISFEGSSNTSNGAGLNHHGSGTSR